MGVFGWVAVGVIGYFLYSRASSGQSLFSLSPATGNAAALQAQQQAQLQALATAVNNKQTATTQQIAALNQALQQLAKQQSQSGSAKGGGAPSGGGGGPIGTQGGSRPSQTVDPLSQLFLASDLNGPQASAAQNVLQAGGTIQDAANAAGVSTDQIIGAISPDIENIIQATAPSPVSTNAGTDALVQIDPTPLDVGVGQDQSGATFIDSGTAIPDTTASGALVQIDPIPLIDTSSVTAGTDNTVVGQDPATDPGFVADNSLLGSTFTPSTTDMSSGNPAVFDPNTTSMDTLDWSGGGSTGFDSSSLGGGGSFDDSSFFG